jgi:hypothetical protein
MVLNQKENIMSRIVRIWSTHKWEVLQDIIDGHKRDRVEDGPHIDLDLHDFDACEKYRAAGLPVDDIITEVIGPDPLTLI